MPSDRFWKNDRGLSRKHIIENCNASLKRLQTDYIDIYYAHRFDITTPLEETMLAFSDLVRQGKVLYLGVSEWTSEQITRGAALARELNIPFIASQPQYSMLWRVIETDVIPTCQREDLAKSYGRHLHKVFLQENINLVNHYRINRVLTPMLENRF